MSGLSQDLLVVSHKRTLSLKYSHPVVIFQYTMYVSQKLILTCDVVRMLWPFRKFC